MVRIIPMHTITAILLSLLFALPVQARIAVIPMQPPAPSCEEASPYTPIAQRREKTLLYQIKPPCDQKKSHISYVFGTFHSDSPKLKRLYDKALTTFDLVDTVALEIVQDSRSQRKAQRAISLPHDHKGLSSFISEGLWKDITEKIPPILGLPEARINRFKPWGVAVLSQYPAPEADGIVLDARIQNRAKSSNKKLMSLESIDDQFDVFDSLPSHHQIHFLELTMEDIDEMPAMHAKLMRLYLAEDTDGIMTMSDELFDEMATKNPELAYHLRTELIDKRNVRMAKHMAKQSRKTPTLFAVGALHLPGEMGVLQLLEAKGYRVYPME